MIYTGIKAMDSAWDPFWVTTKYDQTIISRGIPVREQKSSHIYWVVSLDLENVAFVQTNDAIYSWT